MGSLEGIENNQIQDCGIPYVGVPIVHAAASMKIPCVIHESDLTPSLANKLCYGSARKVCCNFPETMDNLPYDMTVLTDTPIRAELFTGSHEEGLRLCGFRPPENSWSSFENS